MNVLHFTWPCKTMVQKFKEAVGTPSNTYPQTATPTSKLARCTKEGYEPRRAMPVSYLYISLCVHSDQMARARKYNIEKNVLH